MERYAKRMTWPVKLTEWPDTGAGKAADPLTPHRTVLLDERGEDMGSEDLAAMLSRWRDDGVREARFVLGAADGHSAEDRAAADKLAAARTAAGQPSSKVYQVLSHGGTSTGSAGRTGVTRRHVRARSESRRGKGVNPFP